jgi:hypothetical protein
MTRNRLLALFLPLLLLGGCAKTYYGAMHKLGKEKRDILVKRIEDGRKDEEKAKEQFKTTLEAFQEVTNFQGGDLEKVYKKLNGEYEAADSRAKDVSKQIDSIDKVASDLFTEWQGEIDQMGDASLKAKSRTMLRDTQQRHAQLMTKMRASEKRMEPVLTAFHDKVLFLKHNLNARAVKSLKNTHVEIDKNITLLVKDIDASIQEADAFIASLQADQNAE